MQMQLQFTIYNLTVHVSIRAQNVQYYATCAKKLNGIAGIYFSKPYCISRNVFFPKSAGFRNFSRLKCPIQIRHRNVKIMIFMLDFCSTNALLFAEIQ